MLAFPETDYPLVLRTDFSDPLAWEEVRAGICKPLGGWPSACVSFVSDDEYEDIGVEQLLSLTPPRKGRRFIFIADRMAMAHPEHPILVVDLREPLGRTFRVVPSEIWGVDHNLSLNTLDFEQYVKVVDIDGIFRGAQRN